MARSSQSGDRVLCRACGRPIEREDAQPMGRVYCSHRCRNYRVTPFEHRIERELLDMLAARAPESSLCPSEVARAVDEVRWRQLMEPVRRAGRRLAAKGIVRFTQRDKVIDAATARGPIRIRRGDEFASHGSEAV